MFLISCGIWTLEFVEEMQNYRVSKCTLHEEKMMMIKDSTDDLQSNKRRELCARGKAGGERIHKSATDDI
jgi:hypothetical protein